MQEQTSNAEKQKPKLLDQVRNAARRRHLSHKTEDAYVNFIKRYIVFHNKRHPEEMGKEEIEAFLTHLAVDKNVAASTQNQAFSAILFLYRQVPDKDLKDHFAKVKLLHEQDCKHGFGEVWLPYALSRKYANANKEWKWQYVFPSRVISPTRENGKQRRHHTSESTIQT
jgi:hypothetical protein